MSCVWDCSNAINDFNVYVTLSGNLTHWSFRSCKVAIMVRRLRNSVHYFFFPSTSLVRRMNSTRHKVVKRKKIVHVSSQTLFPVSLSVFGPAVDLSLDRSCVRSLPAQKYKLFCSLETAAFLFFFSYPVNTSQRVKGAISGTNYLRKTIETRSESTLV